MKQILAVLLCTAAFAWAQGPDTATIEKEVRELDQKATNAVLHRDIPTLEKLWAEDFTVNSPQNRIAKDRNEVFGFIRNGIIDYSTFDRDVEVVRVHGDTVILMGAETIKPQGKAPNAGKTIHRRFTNVWMKRDGRWQMTARHANIVPPVQ